jgi:tripeptidyl-peptidase-1
VVQTDIEDDGHWIKFRIPVGKAEAMLYTKFYIYHNEAANANAVRTRQYSVPFNLYDHVHFVHPNVHFDQVRPQLQPQRKRSAASLHPGKPAGYDPILCNNTIAPDCIRGLYEFKGFQADPNSGANPGIFGLLHNYTQFDD